jgi:hypothetical protein
VCGVEERVKACVEVWVCVEVVEGRIVSESCVYESIFYEFIVVWRNGSRIIFVCWHSFSLLHTCMYLFVNQIGCLRPSGVYPGLQKR